MILSQSCEVWNGSLDPVLIAAADIIKWRLKSGFSWNHEIREFFWSQLCQTFPSDMLPKGTVRAALDTAVDYLATIAPVKVVVRARCLECENDMGWFKYEFEGSVEINTTNLKAVPNSLADLYLVMIARQMKKLLGPGGKRVQCDLCDTRGAALSEISIANLSLPSVFILRFLVKQNCTQTVSCKVEETIKLGSCEYNLTAAVLSKPMHFVAVTKIQGEFYNLDNLDDSEGKKSFSTFKAAVMNKEAFDKEEIILNKRSSDTRRAGAVQFSVYTGNSQVGEDFEKYSCVAKNVNKMLFPTNAALGSGDPGAKVDNLEANPIDDVTETVRKQTDSGCDDVAIGTENRTNVDEGNSEHDVFDSDTNKDEVHSEDIESDLEDIEVDYQSNEAECEEFGDEFRIENLEKLEDEPLLKVDLRLRTFQDMGRLCRLFPGAYYDHDKNAWCCRKCQAFSFPRSASNAWISIGVRLGDHPIRKMRKHFESNLHLKSIETEQLFNKPSVYKLLTNHALESAVKKEVANRKTLKAMLTVALYMAKHRLPNDCFGDMINLLANAGSEEIKKYLAQCPKNASYLSSNSHKEILEVMNDFVETPILEAAKGQLFTIFIDETTAVGNQSMANVYILFDDGKGVNEHYLGTVNMNSGLGLTAKHFYTAAYDLCKKKGISLKNCAFSEMDGCSTNQGRRKGLKNYFIYHNPHHISESCGSHKAALLPQKLIVDGEYRCLQEADGIAVGLSAFFKESSLRTAILENTQTVLNLKKLKLISPASTRWLSHLQCSERLIEVLPSVLAALNGIYTDREDVKALGFMLAIIRPDFLLSCLALHDVFKAMSLLIHWLQTSPGRADITRVPVLVRSTVDKLLYLAGDESKEGSMETKEFNDRKFTLEKYSELHGIVDKFVQSTPAAGTTRRRRRVATDSEDVQAVFESFREEVFEPFAEEMAANVEKSLEVDPVSKAFACIDVKNFPDSEADLQLFGEDDLEMLIGWYGAVKRGVYPSDVEQVSTVDPIIHPEETRVEYKSFKKLLKSEQRNFLKAKRKSQEVCERKLDSIKKNSNSGRDKRRIEHLEKELKALNSKDLMLNDIYLIISKPENSFQMPNMKKLVLLATLSPVGNAVVERLFSLMNITKTLLRNRMGDKTLDMLLRLNKEAPEVWTEDEKDELVNIWIERRRTKDTNPRWKL